MELHGLITFNLTKRGLFYDIVPNNVLHFIHLPRAIHIVKQLYGDLHGKIISELAFHGRASYEKCINPLLASFPEKQVTKFGFLDISCVV
jgi:hypothetical protein